MGEKEKKSMVSAGEDSNKNFMEEWKIARETLAKFDDRLHDLRKYGFSFITALLTAQSLLMSDSKALPDGVKVTVLIVTLTLIIALHLIDRIYQVIQEAVSTRAKILERTLNLELTEDIAFRYETNRLRWYVAGVYIAFTIGVSILGGAILYPNYIYIVPLGLVVIVTLILIVRRVKPHYKHGMIDWSLDRLECRPNEEVGITLTNLGEREIKFNENKEANYIMWKIVREDNLTKVMHTETLNRELKLKGGDSYTWILKIPSKEEGIYRVYRRTVVRKGELVPLFRKLRVKLPKKD
jgi:hypothetical protein